MMTSAGAALNALPSSRSKEDFMLDDCRGRGRYGKRRRIYPLPPPRPGGQQLGKVGLSPWEGRIKDYLDEG